MSLEAESERIKKARWDGEGTVCSACHQRAKVYRRNIYGKQALELIRLVELYEADPGYHEFDGRDLGKLQYWKLVELEPSESPERANRTASWRPTNEGVAFACGATTVPKYVYVYNGQVLDVSESERVHIVDVLPEDFDYNSIFQTGGG